MWSMSASATRGTLKVDVSGSGSRSRPIRSLGSNQPACRRHSPRKRRPDSQSRNRLPGCGTMAVTPVRASSPRMIWCTPTSTPATSVIASSGPVGRMPTFSPEIRKLAGVCWKWCSEMRGGHQRIITAARICMVIAPDYICGSRLSFDNCDNDAGHHANHVEREIFRPTRK